ncbi:hypothetical protein IKB17_02025 [bacterium]|nr:hypothetical protein [bacterium]
MLNFKKNIVVGVSINPEIGLEIAQVDFESKTVLKYGYKPLAYDSKQRQIADLDTFKETLLELLEEMEIPKGSEVVLSIPTVSFSVGNYPSTFNEQELLSAIEEDVSGHYLFKENAPLLSAAMLPSQSIQFNRVVYTATQKAQMMEIAYQFVELGYKLIAVDTSVTSTLNALIYTGRIEINADINWLLLIVEANSCKIISLQGKTIVDAFEEPITIGEVLGDEENYSIVTGAVNPIIKSLPSKCLYVVSKTNIVSAEKISEKLHYNSQIIYQEVNCFNTTPFLELSSELDSKLSKQISLDVIGAGIYNVFTDYAPVVLNLYNESLGDIYLSQQPPTLRFLSLTYKLTNENLIKLFVALFILTVIVTVIIMVPVNLLKSNNDKKESIIQSEIVKKQAYIKEKEALVSGDKFNENDEVRFGLVANKAIYTYFTIVGTEIPQKLWLTKLDLGEFITIEGQADNIESIYSFYRNIKDYNPNTDIKLQKLALASKTKHTPVSETSSEIEPTLSVSNADFYEFRISNAPENKKTKAADDNSMEALLGIPELEAIEK